MNRFIVYQKKYYNQALSEIKSGKKTGHWMWFIFPQIIGLGSSLINIKFSIKNLSEAREYLENDYLRNNLINICLELLKLDSDSVSIFGHVDSMKLRSSMTLFDYVSDKYNFGIDVFKSVLIKYYDGEYDDLTLQIIDSFKQKNISFF